MRGLLLALLVVVATTGCSSVLSPTFPVALTTHADGWTAGWDVARLTGPLGEEVTFRVALEHGAWSADHLDVHVNGADVWLEPASAASVPSGRNVTVVGHALLDGDGPLTLRLGWYNGSSYGPDGGSAAIPGPPMAIDRNGTPLPPATNDSTVPAGFHARVDGSRVVASFATGKEATSSSRPSGKASCGTRAGAPSSSGSSSTRRTTRARA